MLEYESSLHTVTLNAQTKKFIIAQQKLEEENYQILKGMPLSTGQNADFSHHSHIFH